MSVPVHILEIIYFTCFRVYTSYRLQISTKFQTSYSPNDRGPPSTSSCLIIIVFGNRLINFSHLILLTIFASLLHISKNFDSPKLINYSSLDSPNTPLPFLYPPISNLDPEKVVLRPSDVQISPSPSKIATTAQVPTRIGL
jgi:hypothetical protein